MTLPVIDRDGKATIKSAEGQSALATGNTPLARDLFAEAGEILEKQVSMSRKASSKNLLRFLAASQYFKGGHYRKALSLCHQIQERLLPDRTRSLFGPFFSDVRDRASNDYKDRVRQELLVLLNENKSERIIELLQEHPYVLAVAALAFIRAVMCENLKQYRAAAIFFADAIQRSTNDSDFGYLAAALPLTLPQEGRIDEAWEYNQYQLELTPHPLAYLNASLLSFRKASTATSEEKEHWSKQQFDFFDKAWDGYQKLPVARQQLIGYRSLMKLGLEAVLYGLCQMGENEKVKELCDRAAAMDMHPNPIVLQKINYPSRQDVFLRQQQEVFQMSHLALQEDVFLRPQQEVFQKRHLALQEAARGTGKVA